jgi:hypothetical protein
MNRIQEAIAKVTGLDDELGDLHAAFEQVANDNRMLTRQIEDLDYLNIYDLTQIREIIPSANRREYIDRLRRLRHENPIAKQSVNLTLRFTLGRGIQYIIAEEPELDAELMEPGEKPENPNTPPQLKPFTKNPPKPPAASSPAPTVEAVAPGLPEASPSNGTKPGEPTEPEGLPEENPMPKGAVAPRPADDEDQLSIIVKEFWEDDDNQLAITSWESMKEWLDAVYTDGEFFFLGVEGDSAPHLKLTEIPVDEIASIIYDPDNRRRPAFYLRRYRKLKYNGESGQYEPDGEPLTKYYPDWRLDDEKLSEIKKRVKIPGNKLAKDGEKIFHSRINSLWTKSGKRGVSELYASRQWFRVFREFMENRAAINDAATAIAFKRKIKAGPTGVAQFKGKLGGLDVGYDSAGNAGSEVRKLTRPVSGAIYDTNPAVDLDWMKTDTGALNAKEDAAMLLAVGGAGVGMMMHYYGEGGDANLATAQSMELPMVKSFEDWQEFVNSTMMRLVAWVLRLAQPDDWKESIKRVSFIFPPIIAQDVVKYLTAYSQLVQNVAPENRIVLMAAIRGALSVLNVNNIDRLMAKIEDEEEAIQAKKERDKARMDALRSQIPGGFNNNLPVTGNGKNSPIQSGDGNALPPDLKSIAAGNPPTSRIGIGGRIAKRD